MNFAVGQRYMWSDPTLEHRNAVEITIIGFDPYEKRWVAACASWCLGVSHIEEEDYENLVEIK